MPPPLPELEGVSHSFHEVRGVRIHVAEAGEGEPLVLLHGWPQNWWCFRHVIPGLAEAGFRVIAPDLRGYGWSEVAREGYEKDELALDLLALLDVLELERVQLIGHDWGGVAGFFACFDHPGRIERFIALGIPHPFREPDLRSARGFWRFYYQVLLATPLLGRAILSIPGFTARMIRAGATRKDAFTDRDLQIFSETLSPHATVATYRTSVTHDMPAIISGRYRRRLTVPTRLMTGAGDPVVSRVLLEGYEKYADDMDVEVLEGVGHFVPEEAPEDVLRLARSFLRSPQPRAARA